MPGPACCLLAAFIASSSVVEAAAGVDGEVAAGRAPVQLNGQEENSVTFTLVPGAALRLRGATNTLTLSYTPRIFYRVPNVLEVSRPLVLHQFQLDDILRASRNMTWTSTAGVSVGEIDYTASALVFDPGSSAVRTSVVDIVRGEGQTGFQLDVTRRLRWSADVAGEYTTPINAGDTSTPPPVEAVGDFSNATGTVPKSAQVSATSSLSYAVTRADRIAANGEVTYQWFPDTGRFLLLSPNISWDSQLSRQTTMSVSAGVAYVITLATPGGSDPGDAIGGTGGFAMESVLYRARNVRVSTGFGANLDWFFDPIAGTSQPRAGANAGTNIDIGRDWSISPNFSFYTILRGASTTLGEPAIETPDGSEAPLPPVTTQGITYDATQLRGEIPFTYRISNLVSLNFGTRGALRGRSLTQDNFRLNERYEIWAFFGLTVRYATGRESATWLSL
jgi:hypothetical protein